MLEFALALATFLAAHVLPRLTGLREVVAAALGERNYRILYSVISVGLLAWLIAAAVAAPHVALWTPGQPAFLVPLVVMPISLFLLLAGMIAPNPLSISLRSAGYSPRAPGIAAVTRHPVLWGFGLWSASHIPANGDVVSVALFAGLSMFAFAGMKSLDRRIRAKLGNEEWHRLAAPTSILPSLPRALPLRSWFDANAVWGAGLGLAAYGALLAGFHRWAIGADPLAGL